MTKSNRAFGCLALSSSIETVWARLREERGSATAEYAVATMAAVGFAGLLVALLRGDEVRAILTDLVTRALTIAG
jgi:predicted AAA+ superfamily ATPase